MWCQQRVAYENAFATKMREMRNKCAHFYAHRTLVGRGTGGGDKTQRRMHALRTHRQVSGSAANIERSRSGF